MATLPLFPPKFRAFDAFGNPLAGGKLYSYAAGTSTPLNTYTTRAGDVANANPVVLDANGEADVWTTPGLLYKFVLKNASDAPQWTVDNVPSGSGTVTSSTDSAAAILPGGRLTLTSGTPVTSSDVTAGTTVFYVPDKHNKVPLYDGSAWALHSIASELSQALSDATKSPAAAASNSIYDLFVWNDSGTLRLSRGPAWSSDTARGTGAGTTELERVEGRYLNKHAVSNGPGAQRGLYVGTIRTNGSTQLQDTLSRRLVWNAHNRVQRPIAVRDATTSWTYDVDDWRQARNSTLNSIELIAGLSEEPVCAEVLGRFDDPGDGLKAVGIGVDSVTVNGATIVASFADGFGTPVAAYRGFPGLGWHYLAWLEYGSAFAGGTTWYGTLDNSFAKLKTGIWGHVFA